MTAVMQYSSPVQAPGLKE